ncbi:hypothetical protein elemo19C_phanotate21 [Flavobacterium phage vB_FspP_elemoA_1-9C]|uniref:Uncharacterized protein n=4 Tax=Elemovirus TaxID=2948694 RepID=A0A7D7IYL5_9CAUD|nr:hypothetical protein KNV11_gp88 [Flavobacterium phage vB_FspP_elemoF_6-3D]YP_010109013.1 hypothetical protein KNV12_gp88 [Flavobacterium phage vB_FspP_elemoE_6-9C]YP_010109139.1 hypothetical protein KNV13_gp56 [Flavobacterium phage vB_FspP_elemoD_13-5B]YP_010356096.1 hypothetical protein M1M19_gp93 [Flavobacterium phage vB_FspP_elemoB_14-3B]QMP84729.1 hypothetical protein elemo131C_phanotate20 [Flavobacterium phage vB_FspP_elemoC_13-1C]QMP85003.1 hypothetical protein elemo159B_phanotate20 [
MQRCLSLSVFGSIRNKLNGSSFSLKIVRIAQLVRAIDS